MRRQSRKRSVRFKPTRTFIQKAVDEYLEKGGKITYLEFDENSFHNFIASNENQVVVDEFLIGGGL